MIKEIPTYLSYSEAGVDEPREQEALKKMLYWFKKTFSFRRTVGSCSFSIGHFANVLDMGAGLGLVLTTDGVGTKLLIAQAMNKYDTIGIDCIANNVNDILCLGAEPFAMLDYIAINTIDEQALEDIAKGLCTGAEKAHICIPGGEIAQVGEMLAKSADNGIALDLVGSAFGAVSLSAERTGLPSLIDGKNVRPGDVVIGLLSSGLHSNGYSFARRILLEEAQFQLDQYVPALGRTLGEELLEPTYIYVDPIMSLQRKELPIHGIVNISGGGLLSLGRLPADYSYWIDTLPDLQPIFQLIQHTGSIPDTEMFATFNMGVGFCIVCAETAANSVIEDIQSNGHQAFIMGKVIDEPGGKILIKPHDLVGVDDTFVKRSCQ